MKCAGNEQLLLSSRKAIREPNVPLQVANQIINYLQVPMQLLKILLPGGCQLLKGGLFSSRAASNCIHDLQ